MNKLIAKSLSLSRRIYFNIKLRQNNATEIWKFDYENESASKIIKEKLADDSPLMISRFGWVELCCIIAYKNRGRSFFTNSIDFVKGNSNFFWHEKVSTLMNINAGFFPATIEMLDRFSELMLQDIKFIDILGSWRQEEISLQKELSNAKKIPLDDLNPLMNSEPWTEILKNKVILVIHPFETSITAQYKNRTCIFKDSRILPDFELKTIKAVQSIANNSTQFINWFEALEFMKSQISETNFDIAIIGCGAYGLPLSAHIKRMGKKAVHLGGVTQLLFGIKGNRWNNQEDIVRHINEYWISPSPLEHPLNFRRIENGCYW